ncbi:ATP-binding protein [Polyangium sp. 6x1]|uniref:ATP-binding protein n=1 Tax=Polyangium sp. 6x1 TaxID=3042689 RepID=UPI0024830422|nr:ATP-binding protein [Polyangium sp. 6x1]MDI1450265.1 ATP-binding protein [Polyangium sp. 6x1]
MAPQRRTLPPPSTIRPPKAPSHLQAEILAAAWEAFSALLFIWTVVPDALSAALPLAITIGVVSLSLSALAGPALVRRGPRGLFFAALVRTLSWPLAVSPLVPHIGSRVLFAAAGFGLMAGGIRRAFYRGLTPFAETTTDLGDLRDKLAESAMVAGIVGGHTLMLFCVAFLRTQSPVLFKAWLEIVPALALVGTIGFTLAIRPATRHVARALAAGPNGDRALHERAIAQAEALPSTLSYLNFAVWSAFITIGVFYARPSRAWSLADAVMQICLGILFAFGVSFYQRAWDRDTVAPILERLRAWTGAGVAMLAEPITLRRRMLRDFGLPLLFTTTLSLFSSVGLYRALSVGSDLRQDVNAIAALIAAFSTMVVAALGVVARTARELSRPLAVLAGAADLVAGGALDAAAPPVPGPVEVVGLGESIERMRVRLAGTIAELERERAGLEENVAARTAELTKTLDELRRAQAALVQGERLASIGELFAGVAHEIYNPLTAIAGAAAPLERLSSELGQTLAAFRAALPELSPARRNELERTMHELDVDAALEDLVGISHLLRRASDRAVRIVGNLKSFSRSPGEVVPTDLVAGIEETLVLLGRRLRDAGIEVEKRYGDVPEVLCRSGEMSQVCMNLLVNAIQALECDGRPNKPTPRIVIEARRDGGAALVAVSDNGPGVPDDLASQIFEPFFTTKPRGQGTGLGLSISGDIARRHGGALTLEREGSGGARFVCRIPLA